MANSYDRADLRKLHKKWWVEGGGGGGGDQSHGVGAIGLVLIFATLK